MRGQELSTVVIPAGHAVTTYPLTSEPSVALSSGGLLIAQFGYVGDDYDAVDDVFARVQIETTRWQSDPPCVLVADGVGSLSRLFAPNEPETRAFHGGILWTVSQNGLDAILADAIERDRLLNRFLAFSRFPQWLFLESCSAIVESSLQQWRARGIKVFLTEPSGPFLLEVRRPDHRWLSAFRGMVLERASLASAETSAAQLLRAPRLRRLLLDATARDTGIELYDELARRKHMLPFLCTTSGQAGMMRWPQRSGPFLPVFADLEWAERAIRDLTPDLSQTAIAWLAPRELLGWAHRDRFGLALAAFPDANSVRYWTIETPAIATLIERILS
ncbi:MAG TPA: hypothetical protein VER96_01135 [Polyangiaceae bacterium]|nr:hypothetical protein [Polyangiaceae bacterium]